MDPSWDVDWVKFIYSFFDVAGTHWIKHATTSTHPKVTRFGKSRTHLPVLSLLLMVQKSQATTVGMVLKPVVNIGTFTISTGFSRRISEPSTVSNTTTIECDDACGLGGQPTTSPTPMYDPYIFQSTLQPSNCGPVILWMKNPGRRWIIHPCCRCKKIPFKAILLCFSVLEVFWNPWTHVYGKIQGWKKKYTLQNTCH